MLCMFVRAAVVLAFFPSIASSGGLIPRDVLFAPVLRTELTLSPDGTRLAALELHDGVRQLAIADLDEPRAFRRVTSHAEGVEGYVWAPNGRAVVFVEGNAAGTWRVMSHDIEASRTIELTGRGGTPRIEGVHPDFPDEVLLGVNQRNQRLHDLVRVNVLSGSQGTVAINDGLATIVVDETWTPRFGTRLLSDGAIEIVRLLETGWERFALIDADDAPTVAVLGCSRANDQLVLLDTRRRNTAAVVGIDVQTNRERVLGADPEADIVDVLMDARTNTVQAATATLARRIWHVIDPGLREDFDYLLSASEGDLSVLSRSSDGSRWLVAYERDLGGRGYFLYERGSGVRPLFDERPELARETLSRMVPQSIPTRDGQRLVGYLTQARGLVGAKNGLAGRAGRFILLVQDGPWSRTTWGYDAMHQWLADRGYTVLSVNHRGSVGFGKRFLDAGDCQWGGAMFDDLRDACEWAIERGYAERDSMGIVGVGFGGTLAMMGMTFTPTYFAAGVNLGGAVSLRSLLQSMPLTWEPVSRLVERRIGDYRSAAGLRTIDDQSPLTYAHRLRRPVLMVQAAEDPRTPGEDFERMGRSAAANDSVFTHVVLDAEGGGVAQGDALLSTLALAERFLSAHLGGSAEPIMPGQGTRTVRVLSGHRGVGLADALGSER